MTAMTPDRRDWLALSLLPGMGPTRWQRILDLDGDPRLLLDASQVSGRGLRLPEPTREALDAWWNGKVGNRFYRRVVQVAATVERLGIELIDWAAPDYPTALRAIHGPPPLLYLRGRREALAARQVAIVGSRNATREGLDNATRFAAELARLGFAVTSGLALGIDAAAHRGAVEAGGTTIAVLATGVDEIYPRQHCHLAAALCQQGALVSEMPPGTPPRAPHFPRRNRIITGLSCGVLVVEASLRSGSLISARHALEQGRDVFAVPGSIHNPQARGCNQLLRQGARLVESVQDIVEELPGWEAPSQPPGRATLSSPPNCDLSPDEALVLGASGFSPSSSDELCERTGLSAERLLQAVLMLEMQGLLATVPGGYQRIS
ncbi:DNA-processing protein DprA [Mangrovitalea sediminis]|uniref:DNA-processing protein DprA n=1 Tax=Mangrovitalea sediminis TaxID=1982043 RepID=UPI0013044C22|nr:DNA-processing protein DprA [Mangrovitalea sediminis]